MDILIYSKREDLKELVSEINCLIFFDSSMLSRNECKLTSFNNTIKIKRLWENSRGNKSRIILYDGDYNHEEMSLMSYQLINPINRNEILLAPFGIFKWLSRTDVTYILTKGSFEDEEIELVTKNLIKAISFLERNNGKIYCYEDDKEGFELWWKSCYRSDEFNDYNTLLKFISEVE